MRILGLLAVAVALAGCGNWSNQDLLFLNALPVKEDLRSKLPQATGQSPLTGQPQTRRDGLTGDRSALYDATQKATNDFNRILDNLLDVVEAIRKHPPTTRSPGQRVWGPYPDPKHAGFRVRMTIEKLTDADFAYRLELNKDQTPEWFAVLQGTFKASGGIRVGQGHVEFLPQVARDHQVALPDLGGLQAIGIDYVNDHFPTDEAMTLSVAPATDGGSSDIAYTYHEAEDTSGAMQFKSKSTDGSFDVNSQWLKSGAGRANVVGTSSDGGMGTWQECWDATFGVVYSAKSWAMAAAVGSAAACEIPAP